MFDASSKGAVREGKPLVGRSEITIGILWLMQWLLEGNTATLAILRDVMPVVQVIGTLGFLAGGVGSAGFVLFRLRAVALAEVRQIPGCGA